MANVYFAEIHWGTKEVMQTFVVIHGIVILVKVVSVVVVMQHLMQNQKQLQIMERQTLEEVVAMEAQAFLTEDLEYA